MCDCFPNLKSILSESEEPNNDDKPLGGTGKPLYFISYHTSQHVNK